MIASGCPHEQATLLWLYGEGSEAQLAHVAVCPTCSTLVEEAEAVAAAVAPVLPAVRVRAGTPAATPEPAVRRLRVGWWAVAAAAVLAMGWLARGTPTGEAPEGEPLARASAVDVDAHLDDLDLELEVLASDLSHL